MQHLAGMQFLQIDESFAFFFSRDGFFAAARFLGTVLLPSSVRARIVQGSWSRIKPFFTNQVAAAASARRLR
jgi:hypothetical protein